MNKNWVIAAAIAIGSWALVYAGFWLRASGCFVAFTPACNNAPYEPLRAFFMLDWVWPYQTLLGGVFALGAGAFVYMTARYQRGIAIVDATIARKQNQIDRISVLELTVRRFGHDIYSRNNIDESNLHLAQVESSCLTFPNEAAALALIILKCVSQVRVEFRKPPFADDARDRCMGLIWAAIYITEFPERYYKHGEVFKVDRRELDKDETLRLNLEHLAEEDLIGLKRWLAWTN